MPSPTSLSEDPTARNGRYSRIQPECSALRKVHRRLSWKFHRLATRKAIVENTWYQRTLKAVSGRSSAIRSRRAPASCRDRDQQVHEDAGAADQPEPEQQHPVVAVADEKKMPQALHDHSTIPTRSPPPIRKYHPRGTTMTGTRAWRSTREDTPPSSTRRAGP